MMTNADDQQCCDNTLGNGLIPMSASIKSVTDATFETEVLKASQSVLVLFFADSPNHNNYCDKLDLILGKIVCEIPDKLTITKINLDENPLTGFSNGVRSFPTLMLFKNGHLVATKVGSLAEQPLRIWLNSFMPEIDLNCSSDAGEAKSSGNAEIQTDTSMLSKSTKDNFLGIFGAVLFFGSWGFCIAHYGFLLGLGFGWLPSLILTYITFATLQSFFPK